MRHAPATRQAFLSKQLSPLMKKLDEHADKNVCFFIAKNTVNTPSSPQINACTGKEAL